MPGTCGSRNREAVYDSAGSRPPVQSTRRFPAGIPYPAGTAARRVASSRRAGSAAGPEVALAPAVEPGSLGKVSVGVAGRRPGCW